MKVLFDHNLPHKLRAELRAFCQHEIVTASYMGWFNLKNGDNWPIVKNHLAEILVAIDSAAPGTFQTVDCGSFTRKKSEG